MKSNILFLPFRHWPLKLLALLIGVSLWYGIVAEDQVDMVLTVPLEIRNLPPSMIVANQSQRQLDVSARGPKRLLQELQQQRISRPVNLANASPGPVVVQNTPQDIPVPRGVMVQRVQPTNVTLIIDQLVERDIPLVARTKGQPAAGFSLEGITLTPNSIRVSGPRSMLDTAQTINTATIDLEGLTQSGAVQVHLTLNEQLRKLIGEIVVEASIIIREPMTRRTVRHIPVNLKHAPKGASATPSTVSVDADIPASVARNTPELAMLFHASISAIEADRDGQIPIRVEAVNLPDSTGINIVAIRPAKATLTEEKAAEPAPGATPTSPNNNLNRNP